MNTILSDEEYDYIYKRVPRVNVEVVMKTENGVVLIKRDIEPWKDYWHLPGGRIRMDETLEDAVKRISLYEAGVEVSVVRMIGCVVYPSIKQQEGFGWPVGIAFLVDINGGTLCGSDLGEEIKEFTKLPRKIIKEQKEFLELNRLV